MTLRRARRPPNAAARLSALLLLPLVAAISGRASADPLPGEAAFANNCGTCHVISPTPSPRQGPNLYGVVGRPAGKLKGFAYSKALARAQFTWRRDKLDAWLADSARLQAPPRLRPGPCAQVDPSRAQRRGRLRWPALGRARGGAAA